MQVGVQPSKSCIFTKYVYSMGAPLLSIIIPTYNSELLISRCLDSIISQSMSDFEILIMDGASDDNTLKIIASYNDYRIRIYSEHDKGIYDAMNKGIVHSKGEWLYFIGSDDYLLHNKVLQNVFVEVTNYDVVYGDVESNLLEKNKGEWNLANIEFNRCHQAIFYKKSLFDKFGKYNLKYKICSDHDFNLNWFLDMGIKKMYIPLSIAYFSCEGVSSTNVDDDFWDDFYYKILYWPKLQLPIELKIKFVQKAVKREKRFFVRVLYLFYSIILRLYRRFL